MGCFLETENVIGSVVSQIVNPRHGITRSVSTWRLEGDGFNARPKLRHS